jgi:hypothetical protein
MVSRMIAPPPGPADANGPRPKGPFTEALEALGGRWGKPIFWLLVLAISAALIFR